MRLSERQWNFAGAGMVLGSMLWMHAILVFKPGHWLFTDMPYSSALILFGDLTLFVTFVVAPALALVIERLSRPNTPGETE